MLAVTYGFPWPLAEGAKIRDYHLLRELAKEWKVILLSFCKDDREPPSPGELGRFCEHVETYVPPVRPSWRAAAAHWRAGRPIATLPFYCEAFAARIAQLARQRQVDLAQIEHSFLAPYRSAIPPDCRTVLSLHNIGERQYRSMASLTGAGPRSLLKSALMKQWEAEWAAKFDRCIAVSEDDAQWLRGRVPRAPVAVIENGVDCESLRPLPPPEAEHELLFVGGLGYPPNADGAVQFARQALPELRASQNATRFVIVGRNPRNDVQSLRGEEGVELHADVASVLPFYRRARICVVPLRAGSGTRLKILEAMALGRPVVSTGKGCEGLQVTHGEQLLIARDIPAMATQIARLQNGPELARDLTGRARRWVEARHDWRVLGARLRQLHRDVVAGHLGGATIPALTLDCAGSWPLPHAGSSPAARKGHG
jgi:glycosyltransferase involved in cell wall biosynthesis